jgi:hypothetical protein
VWHDKDSSLLKGPERQAYTGLSFAINSPAMVSSTRVKDSREERKTVNDKSIFICLMVDIILLYLSVDSYCIASFV